MKYQLPLYATSAAAIHRVWDAMGDAEPQRLEDAFRSHQVLGSYDMVCVDLVEVCLPHGWDDTASTWRQMLEQVRRQTTA